MFMNQIGPVSQNYKVLNKFKIGQTFFTSNNLFSELEQFPITLNFKREPF